MKNMTLVRILFLDPIPCPADYPFIINDNKTCCKYFRRKYDPDSEASLDGSLLEIMDSPNMCFDDQFVECANVPLGSTCFANPDGDCKYFVVMLIGHNSIIAFFSILP